MIKWLHVDQEYETHCESKQQLIIKVRVVTIKLFSVFERVSSYDHVIAFLYVN